MFWFHGLSAGNRFVPRSVARAVAIGIAMAQLKTKPPTNWILHQQAIRRLSHIGEERATRAGGDGAFGVDRDGLELPTEERAGQAGAGCPGEAGDDLAHPVDCRAPPHGQSQDPAADVIRLDTR
jgi:hypothetical protein